MNAAFRRSSAVETLENYAAIVVLHLALLVAFPTHSAANHWQNEVKTFQNVFRRFNKGKKGRRNFDREMVIDALNDVICDAESQLSVEVAIEEKGLKLTQDIDWTAVRAAIEKVADEVLAPGVEA